MTTRTIQTSQHTHNCAPAPEQLQPPRRPRGRGATHDGPASAPRPAAPWPWAARISKPDKLLLQPAHVVGASSDSIRLSCSSMEACRDEGEMVRGEGVGVGVLSAPKAVGTSTAVVIQPLLRCAGFMPKISYLLPNQLLGRCGRREAVGRDAAGCFALGRSSTMRARALA